MVVLVLAFSMPPLACTKIRGNKEEKTDWAEMAATNTEYLAGKHIAQYFLALRTDPPGIASPTGDGSYDAGTNATVSTRALKLVNRYF